MSQKGKNGKQSKNGKFELSKLDIQPHDAPPAPLGRYNNPPLIPDKAEMRDELLEDAGYTEKKGGDQLNCDVFYRTLFGYDLEPALQCAKLLAMPDDEIERVVRNAMSDAMEHWFYRLRCGLLSGIDLSESGRKCLTGLASFSNMKDGSNAYPSQARLARDLECSRSQVKRGLRKLEEDGWIKRTETRKVGGDKERKLIVWKINVEKLESLSMEDASGQS